MGQLKSPVTVSVQFISPITPHLIPSHALHLPQLMGWFKDAGSAHTWGGPSLQYPFRWAQFLQDIRWQQLASYSLIDATASAKPPSQQYLLGFGQVYERLDRHHLGRLAVAPQQRGCGHGKTLILQLLGRAQKQRPRRQASLFVYRDNLSARRCYHNLGFVEAPYPPDAPQLRGALFMIKQLSN